MNKLLKIFTMVALVVLLSSCSDGDSSTGYYDFADENPTPPGGLE